MGLCIAVISVINTTGLSLHVGSGDPSIRTRPREKQVTESSLESSLWTGLELRTQDQPKKNECVLFLTDHSRQMKRNVDKGYFYSVGSERCSSG